MNEKIVKIKAFIKENKITYKEISEKTGIPEGTLKHIFSGVTKNPRIDTIQAIENAINYKEHKSLSNSYYTTEEEQIIEMYRELSKNNKEVVLRNMYILLDPDQRQNYDILKKIK